MAVTQADAPKSKNKKKDKDLVAQVTKEVKSAFDASQFLRAQMKDDMSFEIGGKGQWSAADYDQRIAEKRPALSFNIIHPQVNLLCGIQEDREQDYRYFPRGGEDEFTSRIATLAVKNLCDRSGAIHEERKQFRLGAACGLSVLKVYHSFDYTDDLIEGDIKVNCLETNTWYCDPRARLYNRIDARYQGELMWMDADEIDDMWPGHRSRMVNVSDWLPYEPNLTGVPEHFIRELYDKEKDMIRVMRHSYRVPVSVILLINKAAPPDQAVQRVKDAKTAEAMIQQIHDSAGAAAARPFAIYQTDQAHVLLNQATGQMMPVMTPDEGMQMIDQVRRDAGREAANAYTILSRDTTALRCAHLTGWELLDDTPFEDFDGWRYPYSPFICFQDSDSLDDIKGIVRDLKDPQQEINLHHSTIVDTMNRAPKGQTWFNKSDNQDLEKLKKQLSRPGFVGEYTSTPPVNYPPGSFSPGDLALVEFGLDMSMRISNINSSTLGQDTQKTVSGRSKMASQSGALMGIGPIFGNWKRTKEYTGLLYLKAIQQHYSPEKLDRIIGQEGRMAEVMGLPMKVPVDATQMYETFKRVMDLEADCIVGFQEASQSARESIFTRLMQLASIGFPIPPELLLETADVPYKDEIKTAVSQKGMQQPRPEVAQAIGAGQGQGASAGVNKS